ncbi:MAG: hypothetical protein LUI09_05900 [Prevotellaceae bacterium]|nr:hypothetical protein [Prevotellaceae bacterium]
MKRLLLTVSVCALCGALSAQEMYDALVEPQLSDNETLGQVQQETPLLNATVAGVPSSETSPYSVYAQPEAGATKVSKSAERGGHRGADFGVDLGFLINTKGGSGVFAPEISIGKRFNQYVYAGVSAGPQIPFGDGDVWGMLAADFKFLFPLNNINPKIAPGGMLRVGYDGDFSDNHDVIVQVMPTFQFALSKTVDLNLGIGYTEMISTQKGVDNSGAFTIKAGFDFHQQADQGLRRNEPVLYSGLQLTVEGAFMTGDLVGTIDVGGGGALVATYKWNQYLSFGVGFGYEAYNAMTREHGLTYVNTRDENQNNAKSDMGSGSICRTKKFFLRGTYRPLKGIHSPLVSLDLGLLSHNLDEDNFYIDYAYTRYSSNRYDADQIHSKAFYVTPSVGYSLRTTSNSYFEVKVGYSVSSPVCDGDNEVNEYTNYKEGYKYVPLRISGLYFTVGYTHTFNWLQRKHKNK